MILSFDEDSGLTNVHGLCVMHLAILDKALSLSLKTLKKNADEYYVTRWMLNSIKEHISIHNQSTQVTKE